MTVFKTYLQILNKNKFIVILYTVFLITFGYAYTQSNDVNSTSFTASKPSIAIVNNDSDTGITNNLLRYLEKNCKIKEFKSTDKIDDALFYRDVNFVIYIPKGFSEDFMDGKSPKIDIKKTNTYESEYSSLLLTKYMKVANAYNKNISNKDELIDKINKTLNVESQIELTSKVDTSKYQRTSFFYSFLSYSILACLVYIIGLILSSFRNINIRKRTVISSTNYKKINRDLLFSNALFSITLWLVYIVMSFILFKSAMASNQGLIYILNSFFFTMCALTMALLIGNVVTNKNAINGVVNIVALGSSFLCGAFVPMNFLPNSVLSIAHFLPSYYYVKNNEYLKTQEAFDLVSLKPIIINMGIMLLFSLIFIILTNMVTKKNRKI